MNSPKHNFAFIDAQNVHLGIKSLGWRLDWGRFRVYLADKYKVTEAYLFIGYVSNNQKLYTHLQKSGFIIIFKPLVFNADGTVKGNVDAELVLHTMIQFKYFNKAIIISGDGDFYCLVEYLVSKNKLLLLLAPNKYYSRLLKPFSRFIVRVDKLRNSIELKKHVTGIGGRSKP